MLGLVQAVKEMKYEGWRLERFTAPAGACVFEGICVSADRVLYFAAILMIDPVEAAALNFIWIPAVMVYGLLLSGGRPGTRHWIAGLCVAAGIVAIAVGGIEVGHVLALCACLVWTSYVVKGAEIPERSGKASAIGYMTAGSLIVLLAFVDGSRWEIQITDLLWFGGLLLMSSAGFMLWEFGAKHGNARVGKIAVLFAPLMALLWIWILRAGNVDAPGLLAVLAVTAAGLIISPHLFKVRAAKTARS